MSKLDETIKALKYDANGLIPAIIVDAATHEVLMMAYMNAQSLTRTIETGKTHFWSRSRGKFWMKGEESGHTQDVKDVYIDCDADTILLEVAQRGAACHDGYRSCFYRKLNAAGTWRVAAERVFDPKKVYKGK